jgi:Gram-negative bacterial TonB protein C-terminal
LDSVYPIAKQAHIAGDVEVALQIKEDGSVASLSVVSDPPLLQPAALDSAQHSRFERRNCAEGLHTFQMVYTFQLGPTKYCTDGTANPRGAGDEDVPPRVIESQNRITVIDYPVGICDSAITITKIRNWKCLYFWHCGIRLPTPPLEPSPPSCYFQYSSPGVAELADAADSKSAGDHSPCGFDSLLRDHFS